MMLPMIDDCCARYGQEDSRREDELDAVVAMCRDQCPIALKLSGITILDLVCRASLWDRLLDRVFQPDGLFA